MNQLIGCCGLDCEKCDARIATLKNDNALRKKTAALWTKLNGVTITPEMILRSRKRTGYLRRLSADGGMSDAWAHHRKQPIRVGKPATALVRKHTRK